MGGETFTHTIRLNDIQYNEFIEKIRTMGVIEGHDYVFPFRLGNKNTYGDIDIILSDTDDFIEKFKKICTVNEIKTIPLYEEKYSMYSKHILTQQLVQIDLLKSWNIESIEITRAFYSYSITNIFLKRLATSVDKNFKFSYLGLFCTNTKYIIPPDVKQIQIDSNTRLIIDCDYVFKLIDLDYSIYTNGFANEFELLEYLQKSKYYSKIKSFKLNSKFRHNYKRLAPFKNLVDSKLILTDAFDQKI